MSSMKLPRPKYSGHDEDLAAKPNGPKIVTSDYGSQLVRTNETAPPYGQRTAGWRPRSEAAFGGGGSYPEVPVAQYPLDMGNKSKKSNAVALAVDSEGNAKYDSIARRGHAADRVVQTSFKDLIPLRERANAGEIDLSKPTPEELEKNTERTRLAMAALTEKATASQKAKNIQGTSRKEPTYVRYTPADQMGDSSKKSDRIIKIVERQQDPMEPPKFKYKKIPRGPPSPPAPIMHSPPRKITAEEQEAWKIPPPVSNWKNPKGYTVPLDKRLAADGRGLQDVKINDKFAQLAEALDTADRVNREGVHQRALMQQKLAEKEKAQKEEHLRSLAQKAREDRTAGRGRRGSSESESEDEDGKLDRDEARRERRRENERQLRQSRMGTERKMQVLAREQNRDISEKVALGLAKPTQSKETMYDSRLFNQTSGFDTGFNEDQQYDKPLFAERDALNRIYNPGIDEDQGEDDGQALEGIRKQNRFDVLGRAKEGFKGAGTAEARSGPVQFEKDDDPFEINKMISEATEGAANKESKKRYGLDDGKEAREGKRGRWDE